VVFRRTLGFVVTPKTQRRRVSQWRFVRPQLVVIGVLVVALIVGIARQLLGYAPDAWATAVNVAWVSYDLLALSVIFPAALYRGSQAIKKETG
jgi:hypothetical protein